MWGFFVFNCNEGSRVSCFDPREVETPQPAAEAAPRCPPSPPTPGSARRGPARRRWPQPGPRGAGLRGARAPPGGRWRNARRSRPGGFESSRQRCRLFSSHRLSWRCLRFLCGTRNLNPAPSLFLRGLLSLLPELVQRDVAHWSGDHHRYQADAESILEPACLIAPLAAVSGGWVRG